MVVKKISFIFLVFAIVIAGLAIATTLADEPKAVVIDKKAAMIEKYKAELAAKNKAEKETETVETITETEIVEIKDETTGTVETIVETEVAEIEDETTGTVETIVETEVAEIKEETSEEVKEEAVKIDDKIKAASEHPVEALKEKAESIH